MNTVKSRKRAQFNLSRHKIRFQIARSSASLETAVEEVQVLIRAKNGWTTEAIAADLGLSKSQVAYRIAKGMATGERAKFRSGETWAAQAALRATAQGIISEVQKKVSSKFI
jgi:hypothetical protein